MIITLCGSTRFKEKFIKIKETFQKEGHIVLTPEIFSHYDQIALNEITLLKLIRLHQTKISLSDKVFVINERGGKLTKQEICYAKQLNIPIVYLEPIIGKNKEI